MTPPTVKLVLFIVDAFIGSLKTATITVFVGTFIVPFSGVTSTTVGGVVEEQPQS